MPAGIASTSFPATEATCRTIGIGFDPWQVDLNRCILAKTADGAYAADTVALSIPRQVGKTYDIGGLVFADSIINPGTTTVWTAHRFKVARESFNEMRAWAKSPRLRQHIDYDEITTAAGNESIPFRNGSRIVFAARERGAIRGFTKVRRLVLDEAQILTDAALADLAPTMNQAVNPQIILMGTPPKPTDPGEVFTRLREEALTGVSDGLLYAELSAPPDSDPLDREAWRRANPSFPLRTPARAILRLRKLLSPEDFLREALGIWDDASRGKWQVITRSRWRSRAVAPVVPDRPAFAASASYPDAARYSIAVSGTAADRITVQVLPAPAGLTETVNRLAELRDKHHPSAIVIRDRGPSAALHAAAVKAGLDVTTPWVRESAAAFRMFDDAVSKGEPLPLGHFDQDELNRGVELGRRKPAGDGWVWAEPEPELEAATLAVWGHTTRGGPAATPNVWVI